jgi:NADH-quinone oxidoreductase subunit G
VDALPDTAGRSTDAIVSDAAAGRIQALLVAGVEPADLPDPAQARAALAKAGFVVSLEVRASEVTEQADVVLPVPAIAERPGTFVDWEGRERPFEAVLTPPSMGEIRILAALADELDVLGKGAPLGFTTSQAAADELAALGTAPSADAAIAASAETVAAPGDGEVRLATWRHLLDLGRDQDGETALAGTAPRAVARLSAATAAQHGLTDGEPITLSTDAGAVTLPLVVTDMVDGTVWAPTRSAGSTLLDTLHAGHGAVVRITAGGAA